MPMSRLSEVNTNFYALSVSVNEPCKAKAQWRISSPSCSPGGRQPGRNSTAVSWKILPFLRLLWIYRRCLQREILARGLLPLENYLPSNMVIFPLKMSCFLSCSYFSFKFLVTALNSPPVFVLMSRRGSQFYASYRGTLTETQGGSGWKGAQGLSWLSLPAQAGLPGHTAQHCTRWFCKGSREGEATAALPTVRLWNQFVRVFWAESGFQ